MSKRSEAYIRALEADLLLEYHAHHGRLKLPLCTKMPPYKPRDRSCYGEYSSLAKICRDVCGIRDQCREASR
jgi:hypothetical protein